MALRSTYIDVAERPQYAESSTSAMVNVTPRQNGPVLELGIESVIWSF